MSDYEIITLINGPAHGTEMAWDGGNVVEVAEKPPTTLFGNATQKFRELMVKRHTYIRDPVQRDRFVWQGEPL